MTGFRSHDAASNETRILALWDNGLPVTAIARELSMPLKAVRKIVTYYHADHEYRDERRLIIAGSQRLALAIAETGSLHQ